VEYSLDFPDLNPPPLPIRAQQDIKKEEEVRVKQLI